MMVLSGGEVIDATRMGGIARFINHSCDPNCGVEKWEVNGEERCGIFARRTIVPGEELNFDYKFESFSKLVRPCGMEEAYYASLFTRNALGRRSLNASAVRLSAARSSEPTTA